ncbi:MAG: hypothetical protein K2I63_00050 [Helicobacter sp.]|nr:hypothetical protein [Helicobacter sp.]
MRKILLILNGIVAKEFFASLSQKYFDKNYYIFVSLDKDLLPTTPTPYHQAHHFDPCSTYKLQEILDHQITDCYIITDQIKERKIIYTIVREFSKNIQINLLGEASIDSIDKQLTMINEAAFLSTKLFDKFPNTPKIATDIGLGEGEIMQISVPFGSPYAYRPFGIIKQKKWKIAAIYRNNEIILPKYSTTILPNDSLLLVGNPATLLDIYHRIKEEVGQFPTPFGRDVLLYIDMLHCQDIEYYIHQTLWLFKRFKNKRLHLCFFNPNSFETIQSLKENNLFDQENISWEIEFYEKSLKKIIQRDKVNKNIGLILLETALFKNHKNFLFDLGIPLLKLTQTHLENIKNSVVIVPKDSEEAEEISSVVFDFSAQIDIQIKLYDFDPDSNYHKQATDYYKEIAKIFEKQIEVLESNVLNPIFWLSRQTQILQILPFKQEIAKKSLLFSLTNTENLSMKLNEIPQLFIPLSI